MEETQKTEENAMETTKDVLQKWNDFYINNNFGIGVQCDKCKKWREVFQYQDRSEVPDVWICSMWQIDKKRRGTCRMSSKLTENDFAESQYAPGDLVWAKMDGYPRWPGMIEDCPDTQDYFMPYEDSEHEYHVNFLGDKPQRSWVKVSGIDDFSTLGLPRTRAKYKRGLLRAVEQAKEAMTLSVKERLLKFSFAVRYKGRWGKIIKDEVVMPPSKLEKKRAAGCQSRLVRSKPDVNQDCPQTSTVCKEKENKLELEAGTKQSSMDNSEFLPIGNQAEKIQNNNCSINHLSDIGESEDEEKLSAKREKQLGKSEGKGESSAKRVKRSVKSEEKQQASAKYYKSARSEEKQANAKYYKSVKSKLQCGHKKRCIVSKKSMQKEVTKGSNQPQAKERVNLGNSTFVPDTGEDSQSNEEADMSETKSITDKSSTMHNDSKVFSDSEDEYISPEHRAYKEFLDKYYPTFINDLETGSSSDTDVCNKYSNESSNLVTNLENTGTFPKNKPVSTDEDESTSDDEPVTNVKNKTISDNEQVFNKESESTSSGDELLMNVGNETSFSENREPVIKEEDESTSSGDELVMHEENETAFSENREPVIKEEDDSSSGDELVIHEENGESVIKEENATTFPDNGEPVFKEENAFTFYKNDSIISAPAYSHAAYLSHSTPKTRP